MKKPDFNPFLAWTVFGISILVVFQALWGFWVSAAWIHIVAALLMILWLITQVLLAAHAHGGIGLRSSSLPGISVVVPCHNSANILEGGVDSLLQQRYEGLLEIVLVENNSTDNTWEVIQDIQSRYPDKIIGVRAYPGLHEFPASVAVNKGIQVATQDFIVRMDDDTELDLDALHAIGMTLSISENTVATACNLRIRNVAKSLWTKLQSIEYLFSMEVDRRSQAVLNSVLCCSGGMSGFRRDALLKIGGYTTIPNISEDVDITLKSHKIGLVNMSPAAIGWTDAPETFKALWKQRVRWTISGITAQALHWRGIGNRSYWHQGMVGFYALPMKLLMSIRNLLPLVIVFEVLMLSFDWRLKMLVLIGMPFVLFAVQMLAARRIVYERQGLQYWWLAAFFVLIYGPLLLTAGFVGVIIGVYRLRSSLRFRRVSYFDTESELEAAL